MSKKKIKSTEEYKELFEICEQEYITTALSLRKLAKKYSINHSCLTEWSSKYEWVRKRNEYRERVKQKTLNRIEESVVDKKNKTLSEQFRISR